MSKYFLSFQIIFLGVLLILPFRISARPVLFPEPLSPRIANYDIEVRLDGETNVLQGREVLVWHNRSGDAVGELRFHLYPNAFRNSKSTFMKEAGKKAVKKLKKDGWGYIEVERIALGSGEELTDAMEFIAPDDGNEDDRTVFRLPLPRPVPPDGSIELKIDFTLKIPTPPIARSGYKKEYYFVSQWFPKIGVYEDGEWNCHQYHRATEYFADFGVYNVKITVPEDNIVGATGVEVNRTDNGDGTATHSYHAEDVHDFVWTTSPRFVEFTGRSQDVDIRVLMQRGHKGQGPRHLEAAKLAVEYFQDWYGDYPYPNLTVVDPRSGALASGGMEYPTLITAGTLTGLPRGIRFVESVIIHEFGHNFWYHLVASNEFEEAWLDEGINTYSEIRIMEDIYGENSMIELGGLKASSMNMRRYSYLVAADYDSIVMNAWEHYSKDSYRSMAYSKPALMLLTLENYLGPDTMRKIMRAWFERYKFKHPTTRDFIDVANEVAGEDLDWFFDQALFSNAVLDYSVDFVSSEEVEPGSGYDYTLWVKEETSRISEAKGEAMYLSKVKVRRLGEFKFPVEVEMVFNDGEVVRESWDGRELWKEYRYTKPAELIEARVDPDKKVILDLNFDNNEKTVKKQRRDDKKGNGMVEMIKFMLDPH